MSTISDGLPFGLRDDAAVLAALREGRTEIDAVPGTRASWAGGFRRHVSDDADGPSQAGLDALYDRYHQWLFGLFMRVLRDRENATVALGHALGSVASARLTRPEQLRPAMARAAYESGLRVGEGRVRSTRVRRTPDAATQLLVGIMDVGGDGELRRLVWRAMETLSYRERLLFELEWHDRLDGRDLVTVIGGRNAQAVLNRARDRIRATLTTAVAVWYGSERCGDLRRLVRHAGAAEGRPAALRGVIEQHLYGTRTEPPCEKCLENQDNYALGVLGATLPVFGAPPFVREQAMEVAHEYRRGLRMAPVEHPAFAAVTRLGATGPAAGAAAGYAAGPAAGSAAGAGAVSAANAAASSADYAASAADTVISAAVPAVGFGGGAVAGTAAGSGAAAGTGGAAASSAASAAATPVAFGSGAIASTAAGTGAAAGTAAGSGAAAGSVAGTAAGSAAGSAAGAAAGTASGAVAASAAGAGAAAAGSAAGAGGAGAAAASSAAGAGASAAGAGAAGAGASAAGAAGAGASAAGAGAAAGAASGPAGGGLAAALTGGYTDAPTVVTKLMGGARGHGAGGQFAGGPGAGASSGGPGAGAGTGGPGASAAVEGATVSHAELPTALTQLPPPPPRPGNVYSGSPWGAPEELPPSSSYLEPPEQPGNVVSLRRKRAATTAAAAAVAVLFSFSAVMLAQNRADSGSDVLAAATQSVAPQGPSSGPSPIGDPPAPSTREAAPVTESDNYQIDTNTGRNYPAPIPETSLSPSTRPGSPSPSSTRPTRPAPPPPTTSPPTKSPTASPTPTETPDDDDPTTTAPPDDDPTTTTPKTTPPRTTPPASPSVPKTSSKATVLIPA